MIFRIFYTSRCTIHDKFASKHVAEQIAHYAQIKNTSRNITGAMTFDGNDFAQILEGDKIEVLKLFEEIQSDTRHEQVTVIKQQESVERHYIKWGMLKLNSTNYNELVEIMNS